MGEFRERESGTISSYRDLLVWQAAIDLVVRCYEETKNFQQSETYGLIAQIRRASTAIPANIAEGYGRDHPGSYVQFLRIAQGSLKELETHVIVARRVGYLEPACETALLERTDEIGRMLRSLIRSVQRTM